MNRKSFFYFFYIFLFFTLFFAYSNSFNASWQFDDAPNIIHNDRLHLSKLDFDSITQTFFAHKGHKKFFRPIPSMTFGVTWFFVKDNVFWYHIVNFIIHCLTAFLLFHIILNLFKTYPLKETEKWKVFFVASFSTFLWALSPIQTQAVTYIVQRMTEMAALFYAAAFLFYMKARLENRKIYYFLMTLFYAFSFLSKENGILFPLSVLLTEAIFFDFFTNMTRKKKIGFSLFILILISIFILGVIFFVNGDFLFFLHQYSGRNFTLSERFLTEFRVVSFYITQILYPLPSMFSIAHSMDLSESFFSPYTTILSIVFILGLIFISVRLKKKYPLIPFSILFFFINHLMESTIIPLELIFEHRNYLPSFFIFIPVSIGIYNLVDIYKEKNKPLFYLISFFAVAIIFLSGIFTFERNKAWQTPKSLWYDAFLKYPENPRILNNLAIQIGWAEKATIEDKMIAFNLFEKSLNYRMPRKFVKAEVYGNMALIYFSLGRYEEATALYDKALAIDPENTKIRSDEIKNLLMMGKYEDSLKECNTILDFEKENPDYYNLKGFILLWLGEYEKALQLFQTALKKDPYNYPIIMMNTGYALSKLGYYDRAEWFYKNAVMQAGLDIVPFLLLIENRIVSGDMDKAEEYSKILFLNFKRKDIIVYLDNGKHFDTPPIDMKRVKSFLNMNIKN